MKAYDLAMGLIFLNAGIYIVATMNLFGDLSGVAGTFEALTIFTTPIINIPLVGEAKGIDLIAVAIAGGTVVFYNSNAINDRGIAVIAFSAVFWGSFLITSAVITKFDFPGITEFYAIFLLAATLIFVMTLVQMPTGGQKSYV